MGGIYKRDDREALMAGFKLSVNEEHSGNTYKVKITGELGRGSGCIVYSGCLLKTVEGSQLECRVVVKELFPKGIGIRRSKESYPELIIPKKSANDFLFFRKRFGRRFVSFSEYAGTAGSSVPSDAFIYGEAGGTCYAIACPVKGRLLSEAAASCLSLDRIASVMEAVCRSLRPLHMRERLLLDVKPENILYEMSDEDMQAHTYIIDFDTVQQLKNIHMGVTDYCPCTPGWAPPEQIPDKTDGLYKDPSLIGFHTDIYSVGAVFFFLLSGSAPDKYDLTAIRDGSFKIHEKNSFTQAVSREAEELINNLLKCMLEPDPAIRRGYFNNCLSVRELEKDFAKLYGLTAGDGAHFAPIHDRIDSLAKEVRELKAELRRLSSLLK